MAITYGAGDLYTGSVNSSKTVCTLFILVLAVRVCVNSGRFSIASPDRSLTGRIIRPAADLVPVTSWPLPLFPLELTPLASDDFLLAVDEVSVTIVLVDRFDGKRASSQCLHSIRSP